MPTKHVLTFDQRSNFLKYLQYKSSIFPRGKFVDKLRAADSAYHLAKVATTTDEEDLKKIADQLNSRFEELDIALVREVAETYGVKYITTFLGKQAIFQMTSSGADPTNLEESAKFNTIFQDQQRELKWRTHLMKALVDVSKYNFCAVDASWVFRKHYNLVADTEANKSGQNVKNTEVKWSGTQLKQLDLYNFLFDHEVDLEDFSAQGDWAGYIESYSQSALKSLVDELKADPEMDVYTSNPNNPAWNLFSTSTGINDTLNLDFRSPDVVTRGSENSEMQKVDWVKHSSGTETWAKGRNGNPSKGYTVAKFIVKVVPGSFGIGTNDILTDDVAYYTIYLLEGNWVLASRKHTNLHGKMPIVIGQTDSDSLRYNTSGPTQVALPYQKTAKQMQDRLLAAADRAIGDRAIFDSKYISEDDMKTKVPDPKIALRKSLLGTKSIQQVYWQIPFNAGEVFRLGAYINDVQESGRKAAGINSAQSGQFVPGNKTLEEYNDTMVNANDKLYVRALFLESGFFVDIKQIIKLNVIQYQQRATIYSEELKDVVDIKPSELYKARVHFQVADALMPSKFMLSPNVQQQLLQYLGMAPQVFEGYDVPRLIGYILTQSNGLPLEDFKLQQGAQAPQSSPPQ